MRNILILIFIVAALGQVHGQGRADRLFDRGDYLGALKLYEKELEGGKSENGNKLKARVANCFFRLNDVVRAGQMYKSLDQESLSAEDLLFYAATLQRSGEYSKALKLLADVEALGGDFVAIERLRASCDFASTVIKEKPIYAANKTNINFAGFSSGVTYYKGRGIVLAAPGMDEHAAKDSRGYKFTRLYNAVFSDDGKGGRMLPFADGLVEKYHIGAVTFTKDFKRIYYTKTILKKDGTSILKLLTAEDDNGKWANIEELNINSEDYSCAHPCLYKDSLLFFVSDMAGGIGGKDIYMTRIDGAVCDEVQNLGEAINTSDDELFPFINDAGKLYFASNGHVGLGGLDVFVSQLTNDTWSEVQNMGRPINSSMDDFALAFRDKECKEGYVSSNRGDSGYRDFLFSLKLLPQSKAKELPKKMEITEVEQPPVVVSKQEMFTVDYRYAIQIGAFRNPVPRVYFEHFTNVKVYLGFDNMYRYTVGEYPEEGIAGRDLAAVQNLVRDAFVISVKDYQAQKKIQNDTKGDKFSDDELLLIRLKNFERMKKAKRTEDELSSYRRTLDKPRDGEVPLSQGYTVVLMSIDKVLNESRFQAINDLEIYAIEAGKYMYCSGSFKDKSSANYYLHQLRNSGFPEAYVLRTGSFEDERASGDTQRRPSDLNREKEELKRLLKF